MKNLKSHPILSLANEFIIDSPAPSNISYIWNFGSLLGVCLIIQIITGVTLAMHYCPSIDLAFTSVEHIMRDVNNGWIIRYMHSNTAAFFFIFIYLHMGKALYYGSYSKPRILLWYTGIQMSYWDLATVITNLFSAIPFIGTDIVQFIWGGFSVNNATLNRFFSLHFLLPFILAAVIVLHLIGLHQHGRISSNGDKIPFHPYFSYKDYVTFFLFFLILSFFIFFIPNFMGEADNYIPANPLVTPPSIKIDIIYLISIPHKLGGVIAMFAAILILFLLPILDISKIRSLQFRPFMKFFYWLFIANFFILMWIGANHAEAPFIVIGQFATVFYFLYFLILIPFISILENTLADIAISNTNSKKRIIPK
ncbi:cytochrome b [Coemansia reversa NRRL 1564]|uniref:Cytochrome b n=1 Tax=Coemansia reversa (strain ATCC 12441 / NRRL 1564) TaxID=763665 RepID=A0A2G5B1E8_COERN|nr:cytochrome b [Coemansia reversa NRRL 1564]|eukprot:PIA12832.1 cytochrome b [Coemansia reversa NRRL 1564]